MQQVYINQFEKIGSTDINNAQLALYQCLQDQIFYTALGSPSQGVLGSSFICSYVSALAASLAAGVGFYYDSSQTGYTPKFRMMYSSSAIAVTFTAASTQDRIDVVCLAPNFAVTSTASRYIKTGGTGPITATTINKGLADSYTLEVVKGTPGGSPSAPSVPSGYIPIAQAYIHATSGMASGSDITDTRSPLNFTFAVSNSGHNIATGTSVQTQLDELDAYLGNLAVAINPGSTSSTNLASTHNGKVFEVNSANGPWALVSMAVPFAGMKFTIKDVGNAAELNPLTFQRNGAGNIEGVAADYIFYNSGGEATFRYNGTGWIKVGR